MSDINQMDFKQLRNEVQYLRDELAIFKRKYEDIIYNLDDDNFSSTLLREKEGMKTSIEVNAEGIKTKVSNDDFESAMTQTAELIETKVSNEEFESEKTQTANKIESTVKSINNLSTKITQTEELIESKVLDLASTDAVLASSIQQSSSKISAIISGDYTDDLLNNYLTGIEITPNQIKMIATATAYSTFSGDGLKFYDSSNQVEGWSVEPNSKNGYGGILNYYVNGGNAYTFGEGLSKSGSTDENTYYTTDIVLKAHGYRGSFVVDVTESDNQQIKFFCADWSTEQDTPRIMANGHLLATRKWVLANAGSGGGTGGTTTAVFG